MTSSILLDKSFVLDRAKQNINKLKQATKKYNQRLIKEYCNNIRKSIIKRIYFKLFDQKINLSKLLSDDRFFYIQYRFLSSDDQYTQLQKIIKMCQIDERHNRKADKVTISINDIELLK